MTLLVLLLLDGGIVLIVSGVQGVSILQTLHDIWTDQLTFSSSPQTQGGPLAPSSSGGVPFGAPGGTGVVPLSASFAPASSQVTGGSALGSAAGPAPYLGSNQAAYRASVVRAYLQSQR